MKPEDRQALINDLALYSDDPVGFAYWAFPWGEGELARSEGPRLWQLLILQSIKDGLLTVDEAIQIAVASGHGIGKSALVAIIILWAISTFEDTKGVVTANTENQLKTKTWAELAKWHRLFIGKSLFKMEATALFSTDKGHAKTWRIDMVPWSEQNTEAFAGLHNEGKRILVVFDEASAIDEKIWEVTEGALTDQDTQILWCCFGNPTQNVGRFRQCFGKWRHRWITHQIDSRTVPGVNLKQIAKWIEDHGEDSDFVRVRVRGVFPRAGVNQFIPEDLIKEAQERELERDNGAALILGIDVARSGDDQTVFRFRHGRDARTIPPVKLRGANTVAVSGMAIQLIDKYKPDATFIDVTGGLGAGPYDRLLELGYRSVFGVNFASAASEKLKYPNKRVEMICRVKEWLELGCIDDDTELYDDLVGQRLNEAAPYDGQGRPNLEKKEVLKNKYGLASPDDLDALAVTFAENVPRADVRDIVLGRRMQTVDNDYNELDW